VKRIIFSAFLLLLACAGRSQNSIRILVRSEIFKQALPGASVSIPVLRKGVATDSSGYAVLKNVPDGVYLVEISFIGMDTYKEKISVPSSKTVIEINLEINDDENNSEVVITATRTDRSVRNSPTRVEVIAGGEMTENISMRPGEIRMLLNETTGLNTQQTSATGNTANLRLQELEGRYTQILRDGFPLYSGLSEGLSLVQIAPLDLRQVEIIKGSASTLYGGGAIAGLINLVSKVPTDKREISFLVNGTSAKGLDLSGFYSEKFKKAGVTLFVSTNSGSPYDPSNIGFTAIPKFERYTIAPRLFLYGDKTSLNFGIGYITENRLGGNINFVEHGTPGYFEQNLSDRFITQLAITHKLGDHSSITFKNSYNHFNRNIRIPSYQFKGIQQSSFSEFSWNGGNEKSQWVAGVNFYTDNFSESIIVKDSARDYQHNTIGTFVQNTWSPSRYISIEAGLRVDYTKPFGFVLLPRLSLLTHLRENLTSRIGGGFGYKIPTIFTEESEERQFKNILPVNPSTTQYEKSIGGSFDFIYRTTIEELRLTFNPLIYYTRINNPLILTTAVSGLGQFANAVGYTDSKGVELTLRLALERITFFTGYSYILAENHFNGVKYCYPLAPHQKLHLDMVYEMEGKWRIALESYYTGQQQLNDGTIGNSFWVFGALVQKSWKHLSLFINSEDLNDVRQTRWGSIYTGTFDNPTFKDIYAPLEGITINVGIILKW
jgi:outer membrane receptor for ferrienterochelin and colicins